MVKWNIDEADNYRLKAWQIGLWLFKNLGKSDESVSSVFYYAAILVI